MMKMRTIRRIRAYMRNEGYNGPDGVGMTSYQCDNSPDWDSYLPYQGW